MPTTYAISLIRLKQISLLRSKGLTTPRMALLLTNIESKTMKVYLAIQRVDGEEATEIVELFLNKKTAVIKVREANENNKGNGTYFEIQKRNVTMV